MHFAGVLNAGIGVVDDVERLRFISHCSHLFEHFVAFFIVISYPITQRHLPPRYFSPAQNPKGLSLLLLLLRFKKEVSSFLWNMYLKSMHIV